MQIAFDSSTLILLAKTGLLDIFLDEYPGNVIISKTVEGECLAKLSYDAQLIQARIHDGKIEVKRVRDKKLCAKIEKDFDINLGEAEAIIMGQEFNAIVATDDWNAIQACKVLKLPFTSALAILIRLKEKNVLDKESALAKLNTLVVYGRYGQGIVQDVKKRLEE